MPTLRLGNLFSDSNNGRQQRPVVPRPQVPNTPQRNDGLHGTERRAMAAFDDMLANTNAGSLRIQYRIFRTFSVLGMSFLIEYV